MNLTKRIAILLLMVLILLGGVIIHVEAKAFINSKNEKIQELQDNIYTLQHELENTNNNIKQLEEDKGAIQQELDNNRGRLVQFEDILSSSIIPITLDDLDLFFRLVEAEAGGETMLGKIAVANVVINRVRDNRFPNTVKDVIYQPYQFEPVINGHINKKAQLDSKKAVLSALKGKKVIKSDTISFWATYLDKSHELWGLPITYRIGIHVFTNQY